METNFLVIGSGIAGLTFALDVSHKGKVTIITKKWSNEANTNYAQGGIAAAIGENDSIEKHIQDTLKAGDGLCKESAVTLMVKDAPSSIERLYNLGVKFTKDRKGNFSFGIEGGHSVRRIVHTKDATGAEIERVLLKELDERNIKILEDWLALDLILKDGKCIGVWALDIENAQIFPFFAGITFIATGGIGSIFLRTTNPPIATGDGIAMAYRAGVSIANMEFIQFHPTAFYGKNIDNRLLLLSEAIRGEGAILKNIHGESFMKNYDTRGELAPRDIVARAIHSEMKQTNAEYVFLDATHFPKGHFLNRFPNIYKACRAFGVDPINEPIPVAPAAHYICGGILVNLDGKTEILGLYAGGEASCTGVHGANRLASNSLLESLVFSHKSAKSAQKFKSSRVQEFKGYMRIGETPILPKIEPLRYGRHTCPLHQGKEECKASLISEYLEDIRKIMWEKVGIVRTTKELEWAKEKIKSYEIEVEKLYELCEPTLQLIELRNIVTIANLVIASALARKESRGLHYNVDYPKKNNNYKKDTIVRRE